jgi:hypothetical protein
MPEVKPALAVVIGLLLTGANCDDGVGGPAPCSDDAECAPICEAFCGSDPVVSASCDEGLLACVCECEMSDAGAGTGAGTGPDADTGTGPDADTGADRWH